MDMENEINVIQHYAIQTKTYRKQLADGTFRKNKRLLDDLLEDSKIKEDVCPPKKPLIGPEHQAVIRL